MGTLKWYKRDPRAALIGMMGLTLEERGAYNTILDLIYIHDGAVVDNADYLCHALNCNLRTWKRIRARLVDTGKLYPHSGCLRNERADIEVPKAQSLVVSATLSINKRWATYNDIKRLRDTNVIQPTTRKKESLSAKVVPVSKRPSEIGRKELEEQFEQKRKEALLDFSHESHRGAAADDKRARPRPHGGGLAAGFRRGGCRG